MFKDEVIELLRLLEEKRDSTGTNFCEDGMIEILTAIINEDIELIKEIKEDHVTKNTSSL